MHAHLPLVSGNPISRAKPFVALDVMYSILQVAKTLGEIYLQHIPQQVLQICGEVGWETHLYMNKRFIQSTLPG